MKFSNENTTRNFTAEEIGTWKVLELKKFCKENKIKGYSKLRKAELIALVTDFVSTHKEAKIKAKSQLSVKPEPLTADFVKPTVSGMAEYVKRKKLAEEKEYLRCWRSALQIFTKSGKTDELEAEIDQVLRNIELCQRRIAAFEKTTAKIDFSGAAESAGNYMKNFRLAFIGKKNKKGA